MPEGVTMLDEQMRGELSRELENFLRAQHLHDLQRLEVEVLPERGFRVEVKDE